MSEGIKPELAGGFAEEENGNGSLMRILPLLFYVSEKPVNERFEITRKLSSMTHGLIRSVIACFYYLEFARELLSGQNKFDVYKILQTKIPDILTNLAVDSAEFAVLDRLLKEEIHKFGKDEIASSGYVLHTLEATIWCLLTTDNYKEAVLKAVNLGSDTDTTGAVAGGLAGLLYGIKNIPEHCIRQPARGDDIENLAERLAKKLEGNL